MLGSQGFPPERGKKKEKRQPNPRQQRSLVKPEFLLLQHPSLSLSLAAGAANTPPLAANARGPEAGPGPCRGCGVAGRVQSRHPPARPPNPAPRRLPSFGVVSSRALAFPRGPRSRPIKPGVGPRSAAAVHPEVETGTSRLRSGSPKRDLEGGVRGERM